MPTMNLARPGTQYGPCQTDCNHPRCKRSRKTAATACRRCGKEIGYGIDYTADEATPTGLVHLVCETSVCCSCGQDRCRCEP